MPSDAFLGAQLAQAGLKEDAVLASHAARSALLASHISYTNLLKVRCLQVLQGPLLVPVCIVCCWCLLQPQMSERLA